MRLFGLYILKRSNLREALSEAADRATKRAVPATIEICAKQLEEMAANPALAGEGHFIARTTLTRAAYGLRKLKKSE